MIELVIHEIRAQGDRLDNAMRDLAKNIGKRTDEVGAVVRQAAKKADERADELSRRMGRLLWLLAIELGAIAAALWLH